MLTPIVMDKHLASNAWNNIANSAKSVSSTLSNIRDSWNNFAVKTDKAISDKLSNYISYSPKAGDAVQKLAEKITNFSGSSSGSNVSRYDTGSSARDVSEDYFEPQTIDYLNADLAEHYGLGAATAYQEALSNTAYQRAVKDMKAAGLNPAAIFGSGKGYTAGGVSYVDVPRAEESYTSGRGYAGAAENGKLFSEAAYHAITTAVGLGTMAVMKKGPIGFYIGQTAGKAVLNSLDKIFK